MKENTFSDQNLTMFTLAEVREISNHLLIEYTRKIRENEGYIGICTGFWDYMKNSKFTERIKNSTDYEIEKKSVDEVSNSKYDEHMDPDIGECFFHYSDKDIYKLGFEDGVNHQIEINRKESETILKQLSKNFKSVNHDLK